MATIFTNLFKRIIKINVEGTINPQLSHNVQKSLQRTRFFTPAAVILTINTYSGSVPEAKHLTDIIKYYAAKNNIPVYCFAENICLGAGNILLTSGAKCYSNNMSVLGDFSLNWKALWFSKLGKKYNMKWEQIIGGKNKVDINLFKELDKESEKFVRNQLYLNEHELKVTVIDNRAHLFNVKKIEKGQIEEKLFNQVVVEPEQAVKLGYIDGIMNADDLIRDKFQGIKVFNVLKGNAGKDAFGMGRQLTSLL